LLWVNVPGKVKDARESPRPLQALGGKSVMGGSIEKVLTL